VALLRLEETGIRVAEYLTALPAREPLEKNLHDAICAARAARWGNVRRGWLAGSQPAREM
jgi:hypothetical protein